MSKPHITISGSVKCENLPAHLYDTVLNVFKLENPMYEKLRRMGNDRALRGVKRHFMYYMINGDKTIDQLGRGAEKFLRQAFAMEKIEHTFEHKTCKVPLTKEFKSDTLKLRDYQEGVLDVFDDNVGVLRLDTGFGKAQPNDTLIPNGDGYIKIGDIKPGDFVFSPRGEEVMVLDVFPQGEVDTYKITFSDGVSTECCGEHLWNVTTASMKSKGKDYKTVKTKDLIGDLKKQDGYNKWFIPVTSPIETLIESHLPLDPYLLGALIGDGSISHTLHFINPDKEVVQKVRSKVEQIEGHTIKNTQGDNLHYTIKSNQHKEKGELRQTLEEIGLFGKRSYEKFIPKQYLRASLNERLELLRGLMDTDGTIHKKSRCCVYSTSSKQLCNDVVELVRSLGGVPTVNVKKPYYKKDGKKVECRDSYRVRVSIPLNPFSLPRKASLWKESPNQGRTRSIDSIEYIGKKESTCIKVANNDGLYLTNDFIVTHNTIIALKLVEKIQQRTLIVVPRSHLRDQLSAEIDKYYGFKPQVLTGSKKKIVGRMSKQKVEIIKEEDKGTDIVIATIQTLQSMKNKGELSKWKNKFGAIIADECHSYITDKSRAVFREFNAHYLYGMTATADRSDEQGPAIFFTFGSVLVDKKLPTHSPIVKEVIPDCHIPVMEYPDMIEEMVTNKDRNNLIASIAYAEAKLGRRVLILTKRVSHVNDICELLPKEGTFPIYATDKDKSNLLGQFKKNEKEFKIIVGTASLLGTGMDVPSLDTLVIACDLKSSVLTTQGVGRITRLFEGKEHPKVIDIHDKSNGILHRQFLARRKLYKENGWDII